MSTCNLLDLEILGSQPIMSKNPPRHCRWAIAHNIIFRPIILIATRFWAPSWNQVWNLTSCCIQDQVMIFEKYSKKLTDFILIV